MNIVDNLENNGYKEDLELMELIPREAYMRIYKLVGENMWKHCQIPTVGDIADLANDQDNTVVESITDFLGNKEKLGKLLKRSNAAYSNEESEVFIEKVISSNVTDISDAGWFYKKLMASTDDIRIIQDDCGSEGRMIAVEDIDKDFYNFFISYSYVNEIGGFAEMIYEEFMEEAIEHEFVHVHTPAKCNNAPHRKLCAKCAGVVRKSHDSTYSPENFGVFSTLMITEHATQASLDSMNKGLSENVNNLLDHKFSNRKMTWENVVTEIDKVVNTIGDVGVQARFYEVALISRIFYKDGFYSPSSFQHSITHQNDALGAYIFSPTPRNLVKVVGKDEFEADSIKTKVMFDIYD